jgi:hypothetical protein
VATCGHGSEQQRPRKRPGAERADQGTEARRAAVDLLPIDGGDHGQERLVEEVADGRDQDHRQQEGLGSHEPQSLRQLGEVPTSAALDRPPLARIHRSRYTGSHEQRRDRERGGVHKEHVRGADPGDQDAGEERAKHGAQPNDRTVTRVHALERHVRQAREGRHQREPRRISLRVDARENEYEHHDVPAQRPPAPSWRRCRSSAGRTMAPRRPSSCCRPARCPRP